MDYQVLNKSTDCCWNNNILLSGASVIPEPTWIHLSWSSLSMFLVSTAFMFSSRTHARCGQGSRQSQRWLFEEWVHLRLSLNALASCHGCCCLEGSPAVPPDSLPVNRGGGKDTAFATCTQEKTLSSSEASLMSSVRGSYSFFNGSGV